MGRIKNKFEQKKKEARENVANKASKIKEKLERQAEEKSMKKQCDLSSREAILAVEKERKAQKDKAKKAAALKSIEDSKEKAKEEINNGVAGFKSILEQREYDKKKKADKQARAVKAKAEFKNYLADQRKKREEKKAAIEKQYDEIEDESTQNAKWDKEWRNAFLSKVKDVKENGEKLKRELFEQLYEPIFVDEKIKETAESCKKDMLQSLLDEGIELAEAKKRAEQLVDEQAELIKKDLIQEIKGSDELEKLKQKNLSEIEEMFEPDCSDDEELDDEDI